MEKTKDQIIIDCAIKDAPLRKRWYYSIVTYTDDRTREACLNIRVEDGWDVYQIDNFLGLDSGAPLKTMITYRKLIT